MKGRASFTELFVEYIRRHQEALLYPAETSEERERNMHWIQERTTLPTQGIQRRLTTMYYRALFEQRQARPLEFESTVEYRAFFRARKKVIENIAIGLLENLLKREYTWRRVASYFPASTNPEITLASPTAIIVKSYTKLRAYAAKDKAILANLRRPDV